MAHLPTPFEALLHITRTIIRPLPSTLGRQQTMYEVHDRAGHVLLCRIGRGSASAAYATFARLHLRQREKWAGQ